MIVIGVDVHKQSVTAVAVDDAGRMLDERTVPVGSEELLGWASALDAERLWAVEDCRLLTPWLERQLLERGEELVRVSPKLTVPERRAGRTRGKSDPIDALAVARAALREPDLPRPRPGERVHRGIKLLVDHRDDLLDERCRIQQRLRWHLHELDPTLVVPLRRLDRASQLERVGRWLARRDQDVQVRIARELVARCRSLTRTIDELNQDSTAPSHVRLDLPARLPLRLRPAARLHRQLPRPRQPRRHQLRPQPLPALTALPHLEHERRRIIPTRTVAPPRSGTAEPQAGNWCYGS
jgi:transposase